MRLRHFMDNKHASREEYIFAGGGGEGRHHFDGLDAPHHHPQTTEPQLSFARESDGQADEIMTSHEVNANAPLSNADVDVLVTAPPQQATELFADHNPAHASNEGSTGRTRPVSNEGHRNVQSKNSQISCHRFVRIDEDDSTGVVSDSEPSGNEREDVLMAACSSSCSSISDYGASTTGIMSTAASRRTLGQIRESLEQKVKRLRAEKEAVDEKIRLAQEEEEIRMRERVKVRGKLIIQRKDRLKKLVNDLKGQLDEQSQRLQHAYSTLLLLQRTIFRSRSFCKSRRIKDTPALAEAPF